MIALTDKSISAQAVIDEIRQDGDGAVVTFVGTVRNNAEGKQVLYLEYEAYPEMAIKKLNEICAEILKRWEDQ